MTAMVQTADDITQTLNRGQRLPRRALWLVLLVALTGIGLWLWRADGAGAPAVDYVTEPVVKGPLVVTVAATGTVQPTTEVTVSSELSGTLVSVDVDYNDRVAVGQVLARLDDTKLKAQVANAQASLDAARAQVEQAAATAREAQANYESQSALDQRGVSTRRDFVGFVASHERAEAALAIARADQVLAEANLTLGKADLEKSVIRSPITGIVLDRAADVGQIVASSLNTPDLFTIAEDLRHMELRVDVDEADIGRIAVGNEATFTVDAYAERGFPARITQVRFAPETTDGVVTYKAILSVDNADLLLRPGMTATATITVRRVPDALSVPNAALRYAPPQTAATRGRSGGGLLGLILPRRRAAEAVPAASGATAVWVLRDGAPRRVEVATGDTDGKRTEITSGDLAPGDAVITDQTEAK